VASSAPLILAAVAEREAMVKATQEAEAEENIIVQQARADQE